MHDLHVTAAAWSLHDARRRLATLARNEARQNSASLLDAAPISSPTYGTIHAVGSHADPVSATLTLERGPARETTWADRLGRLDGKLEWLADQLDGAGLGGNPLDRIRDALRFALPGTARIVHQHLVDEEAWVRDAIGQPRPTQAMPGECNACQARALRVHTAGPESAWTVVCAGTWQNGVHNPCLCVGSGCRCGMRGAVEGVTHIWPRADVLKAADRQETPA